MGKIDIKQSIRTLDFGCQYDIRVQGIFRENGIFSIRDLCQWSRRDLMRMRYLGNKSVMGIEAVLEKYDLRLGMTDKELDEYAGIDHREKEASSVLSIQEDTEAGKWEQRRYEIAKDLCVNQCITAYDAVQEADKLIRALKGLPNRN